MYLFNHIYFYIFNQTSAKIYNLVIQKINKILISTALSKFQNKLKKIPINILQAQLVHFYSNQLQ